MDINNYEYGVDQKIEGSLKTRKTLLLILYFAFTILAFTIVFISHWLPLGAIVPFLLYILILATWRYVQVDNKYYIKQGHLSFARKYGNSKEKVITDFQLKSAEYIAPIRVSAEKISDFAPKKEYSGLSCEASKDTGYVALYTDSKGERCALYFEIFDDTVKVLKYYNPNTIS